MGPNLQRGALSRKRVTELIELHTQRVGACDTPKFSSRRAPDEKILRFFTLEEKF